MDTRKNNTPMLLNTDEAAKAIGFSQKTLESWRLHGTGPKYVKIGTGKRSAVRYRPADLATWITQHVVETNY